MPNTNQGQKPSGGSAQQHGQQAAQHGQQAVQQGAQDLQRGAEQAGDRLKEQVGQAADRLKQGYGEAKDQALAGYRQAEEAIAGNPMQSILIGFGVGFGIGLAVTVLLGGKSREQTWAEKYLPESLQDAPERARSFVSKQSKEIPDNYKTLLGQLKDLPRSVSEYLPPSIAKLLG